MGKREVLYSLSDMLNTMIALLPCLPKRGEIGKLKRGKETSGKHQGQWLLNPFRLKTQRSGNPGKSAATSKWKYRGRWTDIMSNVLSKKNTEGDIPLFTDKNAAYVDRKYIVATHFTVVSGKEATNNTL